jgi:hypothetical protein
VGLEFPKYPGDVSDGDERAYSPKKTTDALLVTERGTDYTRRLETDSNRNLYVNVGGSSLSVSILTKGTVLGLADGVPATVVSFVASSTTMISRIGCSGNGPTDFMLYINTDKKETKRSDTLDLDKEFIFDPMLALNNNDVVEIRVIHHAVGKLKDCNVTIYGV